MIIYNFICSDQYIDDMDKIIDIPTVKDYLMLHITSDTDIRSISAEPSKEWQAVRQMSIAVRLCNKFVIKRIYTMKKEPNQPTKCSWSGWLLPSASHFR